MVKRIGWIAPVVIASMLPAFLSPCGRSDLATGCAATTDEQMVPDNPSEHTPPVQPSLIAT